MVRLKHRYMVSLVTDSRTNKPANVTEHAMYCTIMAGVRYLHGAFGDAAVVNGFTLRYLNKHTGLVMVRARRGPHRLVASALPLITELKSEKDSDHKVNICMTTLYTGACIKQCLLFIKSYQMQEYHKAAVEMNDDERQELFKLYMDFKIQ